MAGTKNYDASGKLLMYTNNLTSVRAKHGDFLRIDGSVR